MMMTMMRRRRTLVVTIVFIMVSCLSSCCDCSSSIDTSSNIGNSNSNSNIKINNPPSHEIRFNKNNTSNNITKTNYNNNNNNNNSHKKHPFSFFSRIKQPFLSKDINGRITTSNTSISSEATTIIIPPSPTPTRNGDKQALKHLQNNSSSLSSSSLSSSNHHPPPHEDHKQQNILSLLSTTILPSIHKYLFSKKFIYHSLTAIQLTFCVHVCKAIYKTIIELIEEFDAQEKQRQQQNQRNQNHQQQQQRGKRQKDLFGNSGDAKDKWKVEDHDMPFLNEENVDDVLNQMLRFYEEGGEREGENHDDFKDDDDDEMIDMENDLHADEMDFDMDNRQQQYVPGKNQTLLSSSKSPTTPSSSASSPSTPSSSRKDQTNINDIQSILKNLSSISSTTSNLALRLHSAGLPIASSSIGNKNNVQYVLKSLTQTEGYLLSNSLLSPIDLQDENGGIGTGTTTTANNNGLQQMWNAIGGLEDVKEGLLDIAFPLMAMFQHQNQQQQQNENSHESGNDNNSIKNQNNIHNPSYYGGLLSNPPGLLLYGPPGCGKTLLVRALAHTVNARFLCITPSALLRKYVGETNLNVRALFSLARKISPCIIFIDEMEGLFRERGNQGGEEHEVNRELKTEFMQLWDGIQGSTSNQDIIIIGASNRPFDVDSAFLRRMPRSFFVGLPNYASRISILQKMLSNVPVGNDFNLEHIARITEGYSGSDLKELLRSAALIPLREARAEAMQSHVKTIQEGSPMPSFTRIPPLRSLTINDMLQARKKVSPTQLSPQYRAALIQYASKASGGMDPSSPSQWNINPQAKEQSIAHNDNTYFYTDLDSNNNGYFTNNDNNNGNQGHKFDTESENSSFYDDYDD